MNYEGALKNIEKEILRQCAHKGIQIHENFLHYYLSLLALDPSWGITSGVMVSRSDVQNFIQYVMNKLESQNTPGMIALKMQFYFTCNFQLKQKMVKQNRVELMLRLKTLEQEITDVRNLKDLDEIESMYKKIIYYITLTSGLGNPMIDSIYKEVRAALGSILDQHELKEFIAQPLFLKIENLSEFTKLVTGIRLFNRDCGKGGEGIEDLPYLMNQALDATNAELQHKLITIMDKVNLMTTALDFVYATERDDRGRYIIVCNLPKGVTLDDVEYVKDSLIVFRQHELFVRKIIDEVEIIENNTSEIANTLKQALVDLHQVVKHRIAIPVNQVFPHFQKLSDIWCSLQDQAILLAKFNQIMSNLQTYINILGFNDAIAEAMLPPGVTSMTDTERLQRSVRQKIPQENNHAQIIDIISYRDIDRIKLEYLGFCAWKIFATEGALLPGNPNLGVARVMNMSFVFSSVDAGKAFGLAPEKCIMETIYLARKKPELINLLNIKNNLIVVQNIVELIKEPPLAPLTEEVEVQTDVHPVAKNIDRSYFWNAWDIKRETIKLANLTYCKTKSSQTTKTYNRVNAQSQYYGRKDQDVQTKRDNYTNVPTPSNFIFGLRGRKDDKQFVVNLTRPVDE